MVKGSTNKKQAKNPKLKQLKQTVRGEGHTSKTRKPKLKGLYLMHRNDYTNLYWFMLQ
jgi:hypothetical protein